jgi:hypothetical protein
MSHVGIEYAILLPVLILQIIVLPLAAGWMMSVWTNDRMKQELQEASNQVTNTIKQLYLALTSPNIVITSSRVNQTLNLPTSIESHLYYATGPKSSLIKTLTLHFTLQGTGVTCTSSAIFGSNVYWQSSKFFSNSSSSYIAAGWNSSCSTIWLSFG